MREDGAGALPGSVTGAAGVAPAWHHLSAADVLAELDSDGRDGLSPAQARSRLATSGPNALPAVRSDGPATRMLRQLRHPLIAVLLAAAAVTAALRDLVDTAVILGVVVVNAAIGFAQETRAEAALDALRALGRGEARVVRHGPPRTVDAVGLVPGDLVVLEAGDRVPADLRVLRCVEAAVDESALTGESLPVTKGDAVLAPTTPVEDRSNMLHSGTLLTRGNATAVVVATGAATALGGIHRLTGSAETLATPLTRQLAAFSRLLTLVILLLAALAFGLGTGQGRPLEESFTAAVALAVGAIPEGLPAAVTITLAIGVTRMARRRAVVRRLPAVETLGSTTVICSDKTGTLTENQMTVTGVWTPGRTFTVSGTGYAPVGELRDADGNRLSGPLPAALRWSLTAGALCTSAVLRATDGAYAVDGDPTEGAMLSVAAKAGLAAGTLADDLPPLSVTPFSSERLFMATTHSDVARGRTVVLVKGAVERVLALCDRQLGADGEAEPLDPDAAGLATHALAAQGLRVLATAVAFVNGPGTPDVEELQGRLVLTGLQAMLDPPRPAAAAAIRACHRAGIEVKMITGDHGATARAVGVRLGLLEADHDEARVLLGAELATLPEADLAAAAERATVFARVSPEQKLRLVQALQSLGHVVAMTGDGVNDAPALRRADIGIAMGRTGTEVAKEAADMVLVDDDFATIEAAVEEGRGVFDNLTKFIVWTLPTNMGEGAVILVALLLGSALPILPTQILWINMTTAVALGLMLAFEPREPESMDRPPREPGRPLLTGALAARVVAVSALLVAASWWTFRHELDLGAGLPEARTAAVNVFVLIEILYLFLCRSLTRPLREIGLWSNPWLLLGVTVQVAGQLAITYLPAMNTLFRTAPLDPAVWGRLLVVGVLAAVALDVTARLERRLFPPPPAAPPSRPRSAGPPGT